MDISSFCLQLAVVARSPYDSPVNSSYSTDVLRYPTYGVLTQNCGVVRRRLRPRLS